MPAAPSDELSEARRAKRLVTIGLGTLWTVDGLLQLQPQMFTQSLAVNVVATSMMSLPSSLYFASLKLLIRFFLPNPALWDAGIAALQILLGIAIILGSGAIRRVALATSVAWAAIVWVMAEGLGGFLGGTMAGGVFPGTPSVMNGFPGAALLYAMAALLLLLPDGRWKPSGRISVARLAPAVLFLVFAAFQAAPLMWTAYGQASIFASNTGNLPTQLGGSILSPLVSFTVANPVLSNFVELGACLVSAFGLYLGKRWGYLFALGWLAFIWWLPLGLGAILTGLGTDPNTPPAIALLMVPTIMASRKTIGSQS